ncbi:bola-like protein-domain-containing protein [Rhodotorula diobovata]|uniref:Bola-like protein-domain-containing protein n=1 Tax=Rhodotorula diobovata TaxID=5288 RepID=A0A5C5G1C5_9BASI|nr:bola-like protein-domain-containing protein [Rhodotorula diobovata]
MLPRLLPRSLVRPSPRSTITLSSRTLMSSAPTLGPVEQAIRTRLEEALQPTTLDITNDSSKHRHHAPMKAIGGGDGETHFTVSVVSERFEGMRVIQRHRLVNDALKPLFDAGLHALAIRAKSPKEVEERA